ncbi:recombinase family protein [Qipengyuania sp.]|uniref:recombinase family protein n=1 Tax=Qipengyuania sp. TaxID=2004515 RepID=UPI003BA868D5
MGAKQRRCAIYTRKSSEEGLDQSFNSLDAQREACEAYVLSQASEGWSAHASRYDDGGYSGGNMERPGLEALLDDIRAGKIDVVVVYKIDRLTRSLADFARIVEVFEQHYCSFVSVTQSFNTTGSMGKLMLNVLLSFAQFEREVTGERIRDKIAASKAKGLWMGGNLPLGFDLPGEGSRVLRINEAEAATVSTIFESYLQLGSVRALQEELAARGIVSKRHVTRKGKEVGGLPFGRGALFHLLRNPLYLGKITHKGKVHDGAHPAIIEQELFDRVQAKLEANAHQHGKRKKQRKVNSPLTGKLFDANGEVMSPAWSRGQSGKSYRYYVSASLQQGTGALDPDRVQRLSAEETEQVVRETLRRWLPRADDPLAALRSIRLKNDGLHFELACKEGTRSRLELYKDEQIIHRARDMVTIRLPLLLPLRGGRKLVTRSALASPRPDDVLIAALRKAHAMLSNERGSPFMQTAPVSPYDRNILRLAFLAPDIQQAIVTGRQPPHLNLETLRQMKIPLSWKMQRDVLGFQTSKTGLSGERKRHFGELGGPNRH